MNARIENDFLFCVDFRVMHQKLIALFFFLACYCYAWADTFVVTSNLDSGAGSLREAITKAQNNGTAQTDSIYFNLPDVTEGGRTIIITSELPVLSSNLYIDASTQPGLKLGISDAKITLSVLYETDVSQKIFKFYDCSNIGIYALKIVNRIVFTAMYLEEHCFHLQNATNIEIGNAGKGNVILNWAHAITNYFTAKDIGIYSNFIGLQEDGITPEYNYTSISLSNIENLTIGGLDPQKGNVIVAAGERISVFKTAGVILIANNKIGTNYHGTEAMSVPWESGFHVDNIGIYNSVYIGETNAVTDVVIVNNLSSGNCRGGIYLEGLYKKFIIQGNKIGTDITGTQRLSAFMDYGISVTGCKSGIIGVEQDEEKEKNIIAFAKVGSPSSTYLEGSGIAVAISQGIIISRNSIFCNTQAGISADDESGASRYAFVTVNKIENATYFGKADPNAKIEVFEDDSCINCEGKKYIGFTYANGNGDWTYAMPNATGSFVVTATDAVLGTSEFSTGKYSRNNFEVQNASCGKENGSIKGIEIISGTTWHWENEAGQIVGTDTILSGVGPGKYRFVVGIGYYCSVKSEFYELLNIELLASLIQPTITHVACGENNGAILLNQDISEFGSVWMNSAGDSIGQGAFLNGLPPGNYSLKLWIPFDTTCNKTYGPFTIINTSGPSLNTNNIQITNAVCGFNGSITGITANNVTGTPYIQWDDSANNNVGNNYNLVNVPPGRYRLKFKDESSCDTITMQYYTIGNSGEILVNSSNIIISPATCTGNTGSITNIKVANGTNYEWTNMATGAIISTTLDVYNLPTGNYQLKITNNFGCSVLAPVMFVPQAGFIPISVQAWGSKAANCGKPNGIINPQTFSKDTSNYKFTWKDSVTNQVVGNHTTLWNVDGGTYILFAKDSNGCEQSIFKHTLSRLPLPYFDYSSMQIGSDKCLSGEGSISGIVVKDMRGGSGDYVWLNAASDSIGNTLTIGKLKPGNYQLKATDIIGCTVFSKPIAVANVNFILPDPEYDEVNILKNTAAVLQIKNGRQGTYQLYDNITAAVPIEKNTTGIFTTPTLTGSRLYYIHFVSGVCSSNVVAVKINVIDKIAIYVPTAFTPNNDGKNDALKAVAYGRIKLNYFTVFNRWGQIVFSTNTFNKGWNGTFNGQLSTSGVYVWVLKATDELSNTIIEQKGTALLIR